MEWFNHLQWYNPLQICTHKKGERLSRREQALKPQHNPDIRFSMECLLVLKVIFHNFVEVEKKMGKVPQILWDKSSPFYYHLQKVFKNYQSEAEKKFHLPLRIERILWRHAPPHNCIQESLALTGIKSQNLIIKKYIKRPRMRTEKPILPISLVLKH